MKNLSQVHVLKVWSLARGAIWGGKKEVKPNWKR